MGTTAEITDRIWLPLSYEAPWLKCGKCVAFDSQKADSGGTVREEMGSKRNKNVSKTSFRRVWRSDLRWNTGPITAIAICDTIIISSVNWRCPVLSIRTFSCSAPSKLHEIKHLVLFPSLSNGN